MTQETKDYINEIANRIVKHYNVQIPIADINYLIKELGGTVVEKEAYDDISDYIATKTGDNSFSINVAKYQDEYRKKKAVARALGHVLLHMGYMTNDHKWSELKVNVPYRFSSFVRVDQASLFAEALLMPKTEFKRIAELNTRDNVVDIDKVAKYFNVPINAVINRGIGLGIMQYAPKY